MKKTKYHVSFIAKNGEENGIGLSSPNEAELYRQLEAIGIKKENVLNVYILEYFED